MKKNFIKMHLYRPFMVIICTICLIQGCDVVKEVEGFFGERNAYVAPPGPEVTVAQPMRMDVTDYVTFTGTTKASESVNLAARVTGSLQDTGYTEGDVVKKGDLLFTIEPSVYEAKVAASKANLASQKAVLSQANTEYNRAYRLYRANAGSDTDLVKWREARASAQAGVDMAEAELTQAEINLGYTQVLAPFDGRVGLWKVDVGNLVGPDSGITNLGTIIRYAPMYAYFSISERDVDRLSAMRAERGVDAYKDFPVELSVGGGPANGQHSSANGQPSASGSGSGATSGSGSNSASGFMRQGVLDYS
ncbi:MAG: efflux RND transporter periplasmic adaptor subunit, partial [Pseudomonadota bacterium]